MQDLPVKLTHVPVMLEEALEFIEPKSGGRYIDCTGGDGSMSRELLIQSSPDGKVLTLDCDDRSEGTRKQMLGEFGDRSIREIVNFEFMRQTAEKYNFVPVDGVLYDLGISSRMVDDASYGASFSHEGRLDMRMDARSTLTAWDIVNEWDESNLVELFKGMDERRWAGPIARSIGKARESKPIDTTGQLAEIIESAVPKKFHPKKIHVATRPFLALRVEVNREKETLRNSLEDCNSVVAVGGVLAVLCYSSFEDKIVREMVRENRYGWKKMSRKAVTPDTDEIERNPRSRSARLRVYRKTA